MDRRLGHRTLLGGVAASAGVALLAAKRGGAVAAAGGIRREDMLRINGRLGDGEQKEKTMASQTIKELWTPWQELWNGNLSVADEIIAPNFVAHFAPAGASPSEVRGPEGLKQWIGGNLAAFADYHFTTTVGPLADGDSVAGRWAFRGTYRGGIPGSLPTAVGTRVEYAGMDIFRVEAGKLVGYWLCADILQLLQQVGVIPA